MSRTSRPVGWPGTGDPPSFDGAHVSPYTSTLARWLYSALAWLDSERMDDRHRKTCKKVACMILAHIETADSLSDGAPFVSMSASAIARETGTKRETARAALVTLTSDGGPLSVLWRPTRGQRLGTCYRLVMPDNATGLGAMSEVADMPDNAMGIAGTCKDAHMADNSSDMADNSSDMPDNSSDMPDKSPVTNGPPIPNPIPSDGARVAHHAQRGARAVTRGRINTGSVMSREEYRGYLDSMRDAV